jgi:hypothetical protein
MTELVGTEKETVEEVRKHLHFVKQNIGNVPDEFVSENYKSTMLELISQILFYLTHKSWPKGKVDRPKTPFSHIYNMVCRKNGGIAYLMGIIAGPRLAGWTRHERRAMEQLRACLIRATTYREPLEYNPDWLLPKSDPRNTHPGAVLYRERLAKDKEEEKLAKKAAKERARRKKAELAEEAKERAKVKKKQRTKRKKHFEELERKKLGR